MLPALISLLCMLSIIAHLGSFRCYGVCKKISCTYNLHICDDFSHIQSELMMRLFFIFDHNCCICKRKEEGEKGKGRGKSSKRKKYSVEGTCKCKWHSYVDSGCYIKLIGKILTVFSAKFTSKGDLRLSKSSPDPSWSCMVPFAFSIGTAE